MVGSTLDPEMAGKMRVSVVATGIDAAARSEAMPMPKRTLVEPVAAPARPAATAPAPSLPIFSRAPSRCVHRALPTTTTSPRRSAPNSSPSRRQRCRSPASVERTAPYGAPKFEAGDRQPGEPSPDALRRLQAAVQNVPKAQPMVRPVAAQPREAERHSRLTINSLIHKMTGQVGREQGTLRPRSPRARSRAAPGAGGRRRLRGKRARTRRHTSLPASAGQLTGVASQPLHTPTPECGTRIPPPGADFV